ncbi:MAG TPA: GNVR domain-containing protein [Caulobacteraceae bacterium]|nr:GNVR domain-containing protein [Caulobacteraceae bacterium]
MSITQFARILWARRSVIFAAVVFCLVGAILVILIAPARWPAHSRVMLEIIKPDPLTGDVVSGNSHPYAATQIELIRDDRVAGRAAEDLGWTRDPQWIDRFHREVGGGHHDIRRWLAQQIIDSTNAELVEGSNIIDITYTDKDPAQARRVADALTKAYVESSIEFRREEASRTADWFDAQTVKAKAALDASGAAESAYERQTGIILQDEKTDVDSARLHALASQGVVAAPVIAPAAVTASASGAELAQTDAAIAQAARSLGPNHPELLALKAKRAALAGQVSQENAAARAAAGAAASAATAGAGYVEHALAAEKSKVVGQSDKIEHLRQLQADVDLRRDQYAKTAAKAAQLRQEATIGETGLTVLGAATTPQKPSFPNKPLILAGALGFGAAAGVLVALLFELFTRRVRGVEDLAAIEDMDILAIVPAAAAQDSRRLPGGHGPAPQQLWRWRARAAPT